MSDSESDFSHSLASDELYNDPPYVESHMDYGSWQQLDDHESSQRSHQESSENRHTLLSIATDLFNESLPAEVSPPKDVTFVVGKRDPKIIQAHKFMLCLRSPVFNTMFNGQLAETSDSIRIPDLEPAGFENMLR